MAASDNISESPTPYRMQMNFTMAHVDRDVVEEIYDTVVLEAVKRGLIFEFGAVMEMDVDDVPAGSELEAIILGIDLEPEEA